MSDSHTFAMLGAAGYVASRHLKAIADTGNELVAACDPSDSVGILDSYFPKARFFTEVERFDRHLEKRRIEGRPVDYVSICTPNYLHDAHVRLALRLGAIAICEKPLVVSPWNLDQLAVLEQRYDRRVYTVLQLRMMPRLARIREEVLERGGVHQVELSYITPRGPWYQTSWKGDEQRSGGLALNIGIHLFDMLLWIYGSPREGSPPVVFERSAQKLRGHLYLERANVSWMLSTRREDLPPEADGQPHRLLTCLAPNGGTSTTRLEYDFSNGFADLHTRVYEDILAGRGFGIEDARPAIELAHMIRGQKEWVPEC